MPQPSEFRRHPVVARWLSSIGFFFVILCIAAEFADADRLATVCLLAAGTSLLAISRVPNAERFGGMFTMRPSDLFFLIMYSALASSSSWEIMYLVRGEYFCSSRGLCPSAWFTESIGGMFS